MTAPETCNKMVYQDDSRIRCYLVLGHEGDCEEIPVPKKLVVRPYRRAVETYEEDPRYKEVGRGDGIIHTIPTWMADILERHADEIE